MPELSSETRAAHSGIIDIALDLTGGTRQARECAIGEQDGVPGIFPALVLQSRLLVAAAVLDIAITIAVPICVDPGECSPGFHLKLPYKLSIAGPALKLIEQDEKQRRGVGSSIVGRVRTFLERSHLAEAHLVHNLARLLIAEVVDPCSLLFRQGMQRRFSQSGGESERLVAHKYAVPAEECHEPG